jgi:leishmanolysin
MISTTKTTSLLLLSLLVISLRAHDDVTCTHDQIEQNPETLHIEEDFSSLQDPGRFLASSSYSNLRLYPYYDALKAKSPSSFASYAVNKLIPPAVSYFQAALKIKYPVVGNMVLSSRVKTVCGQTTPSVLFTGVAADVFIYYDSDTESGTQIAATSQCYVATSGRTLISRTVMNRNMIPVTTDVLIHEKNMYTIMHEMMHTFGFSSVLYPRFLDTNGKTRTGHIKSVSIGGSTRSVIDVPPLTGMLQEYYGCSTVPGLILENGGGSDTTSSHVERKYFLYDFMASGSIFGRRVSQFSLAFLEGSGWFQPDYSYAEPFFYGKGQGCSFITGTCSSGSSNFEEYCVGSSRGCSPTGRGGGSCQSDSLTENCRYYYPSENNDCENDNGADYARFPSLETYGRSTNSRCFAGNLNTRDSNSPTSFCFKYSCSGSGSSTQLTVNVGNNQVVCTQAGTQTVNGYYGSIDCPNPQEFCETIGLQYCPRSCMGRGSCVNNKCVCNSGYTGIDCALTA